MNIFYLSRSPWESAEMMVDKHVVKMIVEGCQLLSTAHRVLDGVEDVVVINNRSRKVHTLPDEREEILYRSTHISHPCSVWCRGSFEQYMWLYYHTLALTREYTHRYGKRHACETVLLKLFTHPKSISLTEGFKEPPSCMDGEFIISQDPIENYRNYYRFGKSHIHRWTKRDRPSWI